MTLQIIYTIHCVPKWALQSFVQTTHFWLQTFSNVSVVQNTTFNRLTYARTLPRMILFNTYELPSLSGIQQTVFEKTGINNHLLLTVTCLVVLIIYAPWLKLPTVTCVRLFRTLAQPLADKYLVGKSQHRQSVKSRSNLHIYRQTFKTTCHTVTWFYRGGVVTWKWLNILVPFQKMYAASSHGWEAAYIPDNYKTSLGSFQSRIPAKFDKLLSKYQLILLCYCSSAKCDPHIFCQMLLHGCPDQLSELLFFSISS